MLWGSHERNLCLPPKLWIYSPMFSSRSFTVSAFTVRSMIHLDFLGEGGELGNSQIGETHRTRCVGRHREFPCLLPACHSPQIPMSPCVTDTKWEKLSFFTNKKAKTHREWAVCSKVPQPARITQTLNPGLQTFHHCLYCLLSQQGNKHGYQAMGAGGGGGVVNWEIGIDMHTLLCVK